MRRGILRGLALILVVIVVAFVFERFFADHAVTGDVRVPEATATIGSGSEAVAVTADGAVVRWFPLEDEPALPRLPLTEVPKGGQLKGPALAQALILGAAPASLRPYLASSRYGESGVDVETTSGIELRFGDASQAEKKWKAAAAVLADPSIEALDYVDLHAPKRPALGGSGHVLPPPLEPSTEG
jgi:cell division septal protein FtsQ